MENNLFYTVIENAIVRAAARSPDERAVVYDRATTALLEHLKRIGVAVDSPEGVAQRQLLQAAIEEIEGRYDLGPADESVGADETPPPPAPIPDAGPVSPAIESMPGDRHGRPADRTGQIPPDADEPSPPPAGAEAPAPAEKPAAGPLPVAPPPVAAPPVAAPPVAALPVVPPPVARPEPPVAVPERAPATADAPPPPPSVSPMPASPASPPPATVVEPAPAPPAPPVPAAAPLARDPAPESAQPLTPPAPAPTPAPAAQEVSADPFSFDDEPLEDAELLNELVHIDPDADEPDASIVRTSAAVLVGALLVIGGLLWSGAFEAPARWLSGGGMPGSTAPILDRPADNAAGKGLGGGAWWRSYVTADAPGGANVVAYTAGERQAPRDIVTGTIVWRPSLGTNGDDAKVLFTGRLMVPDLGLVADISVEATREANLEATNVIVMQIAATRGQILQYAFPRPLGVDVDADLSKEGMTIPVGFNHVIFGFPGAGAKTREALDSLARAEALEFGLIYDGGERRAVVVPWPPEVARTFAPKGG